MNDHTQKKEEKQNTFIFTFILYQNFSNSSTLFSKSSPLGLLLANQP